MHSATTEAVVHPVVHPVVHGTSDGFDSDLGLSSFIHQVLIPFIVYGLAVTIAVIALLMWLQNRANRRATPSWVIAWNVNAARVRVAEAIQTARENRLIAADLKGTPVSEPATRTSGTAGTSQDKQAVSAGTAGGPARLSLIRSTGQNGQGIVEGKRSA